MPSMVGGEPGLGQLRGEPLQRVHMRLGKGRLVHAGLVGADGTQRVEVGEDTGAVGAGARVGHRAATFMNGNATMF